MRRIFKRKLKKYGFLFLAIIIPLIVIAGLIITTNNEKKPEFTFVNFTEIRNNTEYNHLVDYIIYNPLNDTLDCFINFNLDNGVNLSSEVIKIGEIGAKQERIGNFTFLMPKGKTSIDMKLECK